MRSKGLSRRKFVGGLAASAVGWTIVPRHVLGGAGFQAPSDTLNIACVGIGGKGRTDVMGCESENIAVLCDVDSQRGKASFLSYPKAHRYTDFRVMLDKEPGIDAVTVSTPDHTHAVIAMAAMQMGKHVFCQKPLTRTIDEARTLARAARETGVVTQMGNQGHALEGTRQIREWVEAGLIGIVREVQYWTNRPIWPQGEARPTEAHHIPSYLDWDLFLGPAPFRPYHPDYHPFTWRGWWDFGTGALGDIACHAMDAAFWTLDLGQPTHVVAESTEPFPESPPESSRIVYDFPAKGSRPAVKVLWLDGGLRPVRPQQLADDEELPMPSGQLFVGDKGLLAAGIYGESPRLYPASLHEEVMASPPPEKYPRTEGVYLEWIEACKTGGIAGSDFARHAGPLTEMVLIGNLAVRSGQAIDWDGKAGRVTNVESANQYLGDTYREGWSL